MKKMYYFSYFQIETLEGEAWMSLINRTVIPVHCFPVRSFSTSFWRFWIVSKYTWFHCQTFMMSIKTHRLQTKTPCIMGVRNYECIGTTTYTQTQNKYLFIQTFFLQRESSPHSAMAHHVTEIILVNKAQK